MENITKSTQTMLHNFEQKNERVSRLLIDSVSITNILQSTLMLNNCFKILCKIWACAKISNWPNMYYLHVAVKFDATKLLQNFVQKYEPVSRFLIDPICITYMLQSTLMLQNCFKFLCKHKIFLTPVYMIFKYSKRFS